jgi:hypothetical protein
MIHFLALSGSATAFFVLFVGIIFALEAQLK